MSDNVIVQFVGFEVKALVREYNFHVRQASSEIREFTLTIVNEAFSSRRVRYQDAPEICSLRLHRELATYSNRPPQAHYRISEIDLDEYRNAHAPKASGNTYKPKPAQRLQRGCPLSPFRSRHNCEAQLNESPSNETGKSSAAELSCDVPMSGPRGPAVGGWKFH